MASSVNQSTLVSSSCGALPEVRYPAWSLLDLSELFKTRTPFAQPNAPRSVGLPYTNQFHVLPDFNAFLPRTLLADANYTNPANPVNNNKK